MVNGSRQPFSIAPPSDARAWNVEYQPTASFLHHRTSTFNGLTYHLAKIVVVRFPGQSRPTGCQLFHVAVEHNHPLPATPSPAKAQSTPSLRHAEASDIRRSESLVLRARV